MSNFTRADLVAIIREMRKTASDEVALKGKALYPVWKEGETVALGDRRQYGEKLYNVKQAHTTQADWTPDATPALWDVIDVDHAGTASDPIPYDPTMVVYSGKYYTYNDVVYKCIRDSGNPLYADPADLLNNYFELA